MLKLSINKNLQEQWQRDIAEQVECLMVGKEKQFEKFIDITVYLTSDSSWNGVVTEYNEGYYIELHGTRSGIKGFIDCNGNCIRKPRNIIPLCMYDIYGHYTEIENVER